MIFLEDLQNKNMIKPGMTFDLLFEDRTVSANFFTVTAMDGLGYNGFHPSHNNEIGRITRLDLTSWWTCRLRLSLSCYKKLQFDEQLNDL